MPRKNDSNVKSFMNLYPAASSMLEYFGTPTQAHNNPFSPTLLQPKAEASLPFELLTDYLRRLRVGFSSSKVVAVFSDAIVAPLVLILSKMDLTFIFVAMKVVFCLQRNYSGLAQSVSQKSVGSQVGFAIF